MNYEDGAAATTCIWSSQVTSIDDATRAFTTYEADYFQQPLTAEEHTRCMNVISGYAASSGIDCVETNFP